MAKSTVQRLIDSGLQVSEMTRQQAESVVRQLVKAGEVQRRDAEDLVQRLLELGRETTFRLADQVETELVRQIRVLSSRLDDLEDRLESLTRHDKVDETAAVVSGSEKKQKKGSGKSGGKKPDAGKKPSSAKKQDPKKADSKKKSKSSDKDATSKKASKDTPPAPSPVGASGVPRIATTRAARDA